MSFHDSRMLKLCIIAAIVISCCGSEETNEWWKPNELIIVNLNTMYNNLAHTIDDGLNKQKKSFSIIIAGILQYMASYGENNAPIDIDLPGDIIAAETRSQFDVFRSVLGPAINVVKRACPPEASEKKCEKALAQQVNKATKKCPEFPEHMKFHKVNAELFDSEEYMEFLHAIIKASENENAILALEFVKEVEEGDKYHGLIQKFLAWYKAYASGNFRCNLPQLKSKCSPKCPLPQNLTSTKKIHRFRHTKQLKRN